MLRSTLFAAAMATVCFPALSTARVAVVDVTINIYKGAGTDKAGLLLGLAIKRVRSER